MSLETGSPGIIELAFAPFELVLVDLAPGVTAFENFKRCFRIRRGIASPAWEREKQETGKKNDSPQTMRPPTPPGIQ